MDAGIMVQQKLIMSEASEKIKHIPSSRIDLSTLSRTQGNSAFRCAQGQGQWECQRRVSDCGQQELLGGNFFIFFVVKFSPRITSEVDDWLNLSFRLFCLSNGLNQSDGSTKTGVQRGWDLRYYPAGGDKEVSCWIENPSGQQEYNKHSPHHFKHYKMKNHYTSSKTMMNYIICKGLSCNRPFEIIKNHDEFQ